MKNLGPFAKAFAIAAAFFAVHLVVMFSLGGGAGGSSSFEAGEAVGQAMAPYIVAALITGAIGKFAVKRANWLTTAGIYFPVSMLLVASTVVGKS